jgi:myo-inositol-1-phosphate synthase
MLVGLGGNNGSTLLASVIANRCQLTWRTREGKPLISIKNALIIVVGIQKADFLGSVLMSSTMHVGEDEHGNAVYLPLHQILPMVHPNDLCIGGWDICR